MYFVNQVHLVAPASWRVLYIVEEIARVIDLGPGCSINFDQVYEPTFINLNTTTTLSTWFGTNARVAVQRLRQDSRNSCLADTARSGEQVRMMQPTRFERVNQGLQHMLLTNGVSKVFRPPFARQNEIAHT
jgi:hypothetical protein